MSGNDRRASGGSLWDAAAIANGGERVSHLCRNDLYHAHLSLYRFAVPLAERGTVLDAGCGSGYGAAYLADHGASFVHAIDVAQDAIAFCRFHFARSNLTFRQMDVQALEGFDAGSLDLVFCSNVLEHVTDVNAVLWRFWHALGSDGALVLAVPPVIGREARVRELLNPHHLNIWSPRQWRSSLAPYFGEVRAYTHRLGHPDRWPDFHNLPEDTVIDEADFVFHELEDDHLDAPTLTALFVARAPLPARRVPPRGARAVVVDDSFSRVLMPGPRVPLEVITARPRPLREVAAAAWGMVRAGRGLALAGEARRYLAWRVMRWRARRVLRLLRR